MDFSTIKVSNTFKLKNMYQKNLAKSKYQVYDELFTDIQLIWDNCKSYNMAGSDIYKLAEYMEKLTKR